VIGGVASVHGEMQNCRAFKAPTTLVHFVFHEKVKKQGIRVAVWYGAGLANLRSHVRRAAGSNTGIPPAAAVYQR